MMTRLGGRWGVAALLLVALAGGPAEAEAGLQWLGVHGSYYDEFDDFALGINAREDIGRGFSVGFLAEYLFREQRQTAVSNIDLQYEMPILKERVIVWGGAGGGILLDDIEGQPKAKVKALAVGFVGAGLGGKPVMPYAELRVQAHEAFNVVLYLGVRF
jgi:hypothetical protein